MASEEYREAKGEFINCLVMGTICLFVSFRRVRLSFAFFMTFSEDSFCL